MNVLAWGVYRVDGTLTGDQPDSSHPKNLASPPIILLLQTNFDLLGTTQTLPSVQHQLPSHLPPVLKMRSALGAPLGCW